MKKFVSMKDLLVRFCVISVAMFLAFAMAWTVTHIAYVHDGTPLDALLTAVIAAFLPLTGIAILHAALEEESVDLSAGKTIGTLLPVFTVAFIADSFAFRILGW
jgi:hypothetical protein